MRELKKNRSSVSRDNARATILSYGADMIKLEKFIRGISHGSQAKIHKFKIYVTNCDFNSNNSEGVGNSNGGHDLFEPMCHSKPDSFLNYQATGSYSTPEWSVQGVISTKK
jgi:hypothetical protein